MPQPLTIVTGLPRSGTSLLMQMLAAGGHPILTDQLRSPDEDNPRGYLEYEPVKTTKQNPAWLASAPGHAVKIIHLLLADLPPDLPADIILIRRDLREVLASQRKMLARTGKSPKLPDAQLAPIFERQLTATLGLIHSRPRWRLLELNYADILQAPPTAAAALNAFLNHTLNEQKMIQAIDPALHRNR